MFQKIKDELFKAAKQIGTEALLPLSPVYVLETETDVISDELNAAGEELLHSLEQAEIFENFQDAFIMFHITPEYNLSEKTNYDIGLSDKYGVFKHTLKDWIESLSIELHITKGIILICTDNYTYFDKNRTWWNSLLQTIEAYKESFIFLITANINDFSEIEKDICKFHYCRIFKDDTVSIEALTKLFADQLSEYHLSLTQDCFSLISSVIDKYKAQVTISQIKRWSQKTAWEYLMKCDKSVNDITQDAAITVDDIDTTYLSEYHSGYINSLQKKTIGF